MSKPFKFYQSNPTLMRPSNAVHEWETASPSSQGIDATKLKKAINSLSRSRSVFSLLIVRNGKLVVEKYFNGSLPIHANNIHSASKSILSALYGIAFKEGVLGDLDDSIALYLGEKFSIDSRKRKISLRDLLTMTSGIKWTEDQSEYRIEPSPNWIQSILDLPQQSAPGDRFTYSTASSHLLSAILSEAIDMSICEFAAKKLYEPLGIEVAHWGNDPQGYFSGGYNHYMTPRELTRFAFLYLRNGRLDDQQIVPSEWINLSWTHHKKADSVYHYGFQWWLRHFGRHHVAKMWGFGGQFSYIVSDLDLVITMTTNTRGTSNEWDGDKFVVDYILPAIKQR